MAEGARHSAQVTGGFRLTAVLVIAPVALLTIAGLMWLWPSEKVPVQPDAAAEQYSGEVVAIDAEPCPDPDPDSSGGCGTAQVRLDAETGSGDEVEASLSNGPGEPRVAVGNDVILIATSGPDGTAYSIVDHQRGSQLWILVAAFALALVAFGRWRGLTSLAGLGVTFALLLLFVVPAILAGESPLLVAVVGSAAIMLTVLYLTHGFTWSTSVAVLGTLASLTLTGLLSAAAVSALHLTGVTDDLSTSVGMTQGVNTEGLLLAGIVIGTLGVLDDVTVTQAITVAELARANPAYRLGQLYGAASRVGRSHIASVVNTIVLAYAGSSLPLLVLIVASSDSIGSVVTDQIVAQEIVRSAIATLGLIAAVPITTGLAALAARPQVPTE